MGNHSNSALQAEKECYITGYTQGLHKHHIYFGSGLRAISDKHGFWVWLRGDLHNQSDRGVHGKKGRDLDLFLKRECQRRYEETHTRKEFTDLIGRNYIDD